MVDQRTFLYRLRATRLEMISEGPSAEEAAIVERHSEYLEALVKTGQMVLYGRTQNADETTFGLVIFQAESKERAREIMAADPAVEAGVMHAELFPFRVAYIRSS